MAETITIRTGAATEVIKVIEAGPQGPVGPKGDPGDVAGLPLTTTGDTLYRANSTTNARLPIGTTGQILKVSSSGIPEWGAAPASGVSSVNGETGAVSLSAADVGAAATNHTHELADLDSSGIAANKFLQADGDDGARWADVADFNVPITAATASGFVSGNGVYYSTDVTLNSRNVFKLNKTYGMFFEASKWHIFENVPITANILYSSNTTSAIYPWQIAWANGDVDQSLLADAVSDVADQFVFVGDSIPRAQISNLGTAAAANTPTSGNASSSEVVLGNDSRLSDSRQPTLHGSTHHTGGTDAIAAHQINGQTIFSVASANYSDDQTLPANRARQIVISNSNAGGITVTLPTQAEGTLNGDTYVIVSGSTMSGPITVRSVANLSPLVYNTHVTITATGQQYRLRSGGGSGGSWALVPVDTHAHTGAQVNVGTTANLPLRTGTNGVIEAGSFGTAAGSFCEGNDARLSDDRDPNAHAASHFAGGADEIFDQDLNTTDTPTFVGLNTGSGGLTFGGGDLTLNNSTGAWELAGFGASIDFENGSFVGFSIDVADVTGAAASGSITTSGLTQATARILGRTTASTGAIEEIQIGSGLSLSAGELSATGGGGSSIMQSIAVGFVLN